MIPKSIQILILLSAIMIGCEGKQPEAVLSSNWSSRLHYVDVVIEDPDYHIWGCSPVWGNDGKVHVFAARMPVGPGFYKWWATSEIAHYVADQPEGPYQFVKVLLKPGESPPGSWDSGMQHNPTVRKIDDRYVLLYATSSSTVQNRARSSERIAMMTATDIDGPWKKVGKILEPPTSRECPWIPDNYEGPLDNPTLVKHPDGRYFLYYRIKDKGIEGECTYGLAISNQLEGPYIHHPKRVINNPTYIEDPYVFMQDGLFHMLVTDNAPDKHQGLLLTSKDGLFYDYHQGHGYGVIADYIPGDQLPIRKSEFAGGYFERPQLLIKNGTSTHLFVPCRTNINGGSGSCSYLFSIDAP